MRGTEMGYILHINGNPIGDIKKSFAAACERASLDDVTPHTLRHTAATWRMQSGVKTWEAAGFLAMSEKVLIGVYGASSPRPHARCGRGNGQKILLQNFRVMVACLCYVPHGVEPEHRRTLRFS